ncbi:cyclin-domain-containing protein [Podospora fimiseda]|uniref:Cyclin-domain-containing protein n=1 Tax=Podospora fimiseda TaxID=252190 RepID=A0AAN7GW80_9PEZI|nr:cyclin-domain-containing protein [Podospora fimiseda]
MPEHDNQSGSDCSAVPSPPPPPNPSADPNLRYIPGPDGDHSPRLAAQVDDIFKVSPLASLKMLSIGIEALVSMTGDIPPTPPPRSPTLPHMRGMEAEKKSIVRSNSEKSLARLAQAAAASNSPRRSPLVNAQAVASPAPAGSQSIDGVQLRSGAAVVPPLSTTHAPALSPYIIVGENSQPLNLQHSAITRKFYSRLPPPISITEYLFRIHRFCPMSTAVYLATSLYIYRLAVLEKAIVVTKRNAHRLLLAGLRVAMKALEDLSYPHGKVAKVGGVSEVELARLEISFCFLTGFELMVDSDTLSDHWEMLRRGTDCWNVYEDYPEDAVTLHLAKPRTRKVREGIPTEA